jgi:radical SAM protein with 4Fe4S-binding SPASM domain
MKAEIKPRINLEGRTRLETVIPLETPFVIFIDPSSACNFKCTYCPTGHLDLIKDTKRYQGVLKLEVYKKIIDDLKDFKKNIKVLRLYKDGEPFLNKNLAEMISYAKSSKKVDYIDTTTNASLMTKERLKPVLDAGIDKINISIDGMNNETYESFTKTKLEFSEIIENVKWLYRNKGNTEVVVKIPADIINEKEKKEFFEVFGDYSDRIFVENFAPCWPEFDVEKHTGVKITKGIYQQEITETNTCPYIFYSFSVNADGLVSSCFLDWKRKLIIGDVRVESMKEIWNSKKMNDLRIMHLEGKRKKIDSCGSCGQLSHCLPDNIDKFVNEIKDNLLKSLPAL